MKSPVYLSKLQDNLRAAANADVAVKMANYMKNHFRFFGIPSPLRKEIFRAQVQNEGDIPNENLDEVVKWCWQADEREWQYICMELLGRKAKKADESVIELYEYLIINKSWWDTIDYIASNLVGVYFQKYPEKIIPVTNKWMASGNIWLQRTCLLFQLKYRSNTDSDLLVGFILQLRLSKEFFIRKAIGWSLREYSKTNPDFVLSFVEKNELSGLSEREALKWMKAKGIV